MRTRRRKKKTEKTEKTGKTGKCEERRKAPRLLHTERGDDPERSEREEVRGKRLAST